MKLNKRFYVIIVLCISLFSFIEILPVFSSSSPDLSSFHYRVAKDCYEKKQYDEALRVLNELIYFYNPDFLEGYKLLLKIYKKQDNKEKLNEVKKKYDNIKLLDKARSKKDMEKLTIEEIFEIGFPKQKVKALNELSEKKDLVYLPVIINSLTDSYFNYYSGEYEVRKAASEALLKLGEKTIPGLLEAFSSENKELRWWSLETLSKFQQKNIEIINDCFIKALRDSYMKVKIVGIKTIIERKEKKAIPELIILANDGEVQVRNYVMYSFEVMYQLMSGEEQKSVNTILFNSLGDKDKLVVNQAIRALYKTGNKEIIPRLLEIAKDKNKEVITRWYAIKGLSLLLKEQKDIAQLRQFLDNENLWLRSAAAMALGEPNSKVDGEEVFKKKQEAFQETALKFSLDSPQVYQESRQHSIDKALKYLEGLQREDGSYSSAFPLGTTELVMLNFLNQGYKENYPLVKRGIEFILKQKKADGSFFMENSELEKQKITFTTSLAIQVLVKANNNNYKTDIINAVDWIKNIQNPDGGFGYYKGSRSDITCMEFALSALLEAYKYFGLEKNDETWIKAITYLKEIQNTDGGFGYTKEMKKDSYGSATADGLTALFFTGADSKSTKKALEWISKNYTWEKNPNDSNPSHYEYYLQILAQALYLSKEEIITDGSGVKHFWYDEIVKKMLIEQDKEGWWKTDKEPLFTTYFLKILQLRKARKELKNL